MANYIIPYLRPIADFWNQITHDQTLPELTEFKGGLGVGNTWHTKFLRSERDRVNKEYVTLQRKFNEEPSICETFWDNVLRLTVFSGLERNFALRQAFGSLKYRFFLPDSTLGTLGELFNSGFLKGYFRGALLNLIQFFSVSYHSLLWCNGTSLTGQLFYTSLFETLAFPLDTLKTMIYCDVRGEFKGFFDCMDCLGKTIHNNGIWHLYRGLGFKLTYNAAFLWHLRNFYEDNSLQYISIPVWLASYAFLTLKTRCQIADTPLSFQSLGDKNFFNAMQGGLYRGVIPFALVNLLFSFQFFSLYSKEAQDKKIHSLKELLGDFAAPVRY